MARDQTTDAQKLYDSRSESYDDGWHVRFARHMVEMISPKPGQNILDLACGTGLVSFPAAQAVRPSGMVIGVDISSGMLAQAQKKFDHQAGVQNVSFHQHSITDVDSLEVLKQKKGMFNFITCASALVLLPEPKEAIKQWVSYLEPGGKLIVDVTHINNQVTGTIYERVGQRLGLQVPYYRLNFQKPEDLRHAMESAGLQDVEVVPIAQLQIKGTEDLKDYLQAGSSTRVIKEYSIDDVHHIFDTTVNGAAFDKLRKPEIREQAKTVFKEEFAKMADAEGKVNDIDCVYVGIGTKP